MPTKTRSRAQTKQRQRSRTVLPADQGRAHENVDKLRIDGRQVDVRVGDRITSATRTPSVDDPNTVSIGLWDGDSLITRSGVLGKRAMTRVAEVQIDDLVYSVAGDSRDGDTITVTCEDANVTYLKRHGRDKPVKTSRGQATVMEFGADRLREAGIPVLVLDEHVIRNIKGRKDTLRELAKARAEVDKGNRGRARSRISRIGATELVGMKVNGYKLSKSGARGASIAYRVASEENAGAKATLALFEAAIVEPAGYKGSGPFDNPAGGDDTSQGPLQLLEKTARGLGISARSATDVYKLFLTRGFTGKGGAIDIARRNPGMSAGQVAQAVQGSKFPGRYDDVRADAEKVIDALGGVGDGAEDGHAWINQYVFERKKGESTYACVRRLMDERRIRFFFREGVAILASDDALARSSPGLTLNHAADLVDTVFYERRRGLAATEATVTAWVNLYDADPGEVLAGDVLPELEDGDRWLISKADEDLMVPAPMSISARGQQKALAEPKQTVSQSRPDSDSDGEVGNSGDPVARLKEIAKRVSSAHAPYSHSGHGVALASMKDSQPNDCSSGLSYILREADPDWFTRPQAIVSGEFASSWGRPGAGKHTTVWANGGHVFLLAQDTNGHKWRIDTGDGRAPHYVEGWRSTAGFTARHLEQMQ